LILPNLAFPEPGAWAGPAVVIDPKGDVVRAVEGTGLAGLAGLGQESASHALQLKHILRIEA
jgi:hypothetical protein